MLESVQLQLQLLEVQTSLAGRRWVDLQQVLQLQRVGLRMMVAMVLAPVRTSAMARVGVGTAAEVEQLDEA